ncbi:MAG TPA: hypothetical protein PLP33_16635 [Leptospiraceae bacterium]|nr:hypothetical protein [Leptospiraceae bacterium]
MKNSKPKKQMFPELVNAQNLYDEACAEADFLFTIMKHKNIDFVQKSVNFDLRDLQYLREENSKKRNQLKINLDKEIAMAKEIWVQQLIEKNTAYSKSHIEEISSIVDKNLKKNNRFGLDYCLEFTDLKKLIVYKNSKRNFKFLEFYYMRYSEYGGQSNNILFDLKTLTTPSLLRDNLAGYKCLIKSPSYGSWLLYDKINNKTIYLKFLK